MDNHMMPLEITSPERFGRGARIEVDLRMVAAYADGPNSSCWQILVGGQWVDVTGDFNEFRKRLAAAKDSR